MRISALGCGTMGDPTAAVFALGGHEVMLAGRDMAKSLAGRERAFSALDLLERSGIARREAIRDAKERLHPRDGLAEAAVGADLVMESAPEDIEVKKAIYAVAERLVAPDVPILSNTSGLMPSVLAADMKHPERFVVTHFWNPPHLIPLVEVVPGPTTDRGLAPRIADILRSLGKKPVVLRREIAGFIGNRLQFALLREAFHIVETGAASMEDVDETVRNGIGRRFRDTGPFETADLGGLDVFLSISRYLFPDLSGNVTPPEALESAVAAGRLGAKTGGGLYDWSAESLAAVRESREATLVRCLDEDFGRGHPSTSSSTTSSGSRR